MSLQLVDWEHLPAKLEEYSGLAEGWDGYSAPAPTSAALDIVREFLSILRAHGLQPNRLKPSVTGGIGVTFCKGQRKSYVEFYNDGTVWALFSDADSDLRTRRVQSSRGDYGALVREIQEFLND